MPTNFKKIQSSIINKIPPIANLKAVFMADIAIFIATTNITINMNIYKTCSIMYPINILPLFLNNNENK